MKTEARQLSSRQVSSFRCLVFEFYKEHRRDLPWRNTNDPYCILVSEIMLQQTQVERVIEKYQRFIAVFHDLASLSKATLGEVLQVWQGLGYNRRAISLTKLAKILMSEYKGRLPESMDELTKLPGIGRATAGSLLAFIFQKPAVFIETNIRRVFIHHFFQDREGVPDEEILHFVEATVDETNPRDWYYALMDYGSALKRQTENPNRKSAHYTRQKPFEGSDRKIRGAILKALVNERSMSEKDIITAIGGEQKRTRKILTTLVEEGFLIRESGAYRIS